VEKESRLNRLKAGGARQYCEVFLPQLQLAHVNRKRGLLRFRLIARDSRKYEILIYTDEDDPRFFDLLESTMRH
jgi:hypothetical protein